MASLFDSIGLRLADTSELHYYAMQAVYKGQVLRCPLGNYHRWDMGDGAEIWVTATPMGEVMSVRPAFRGTASLGMGILSQIPSERSPLAGLLKGVFSFEDPTPLYFEVPDFAMHHNLRVPALLPVQLTAFAYQVTIYRTAAAFYAADHIEGDLDTETFLPAWLIAEYAGKAPHISADAFFTGTVVRTRPRYNTISGGTFLWAQVQTIGGLIDVIAHPDTAEGVFMKNSVIKGQFGLSGRLTESLKEDTPS